MMRRTVLALLVTCLVFALRAPSSNTSLAARQKIGASPADPFAVALDEEMAGWWRTKPGVVSAVSAGIWTIFLAGWIYFFHTPLPLWLPPGIPDIRWPSEMIWITVALVAFVILALIKAFSAKPSRHEMMSSREG